MHLLDFPAELLAAIIHELVLDIGIAEAWNYRLVCKTFSRAMLYNILARQHLLMFNCERSASILHAVLESLDNRYTFLASRITQLLGVNPYVVKRIQMLADFLSKEGCQQSTPVKSSLEIICAVLAKERMDDDFVDLLYVPQCNVKLDPPTVHVGAVHQCDTLTITERISVAAATNNTHLFRHLLKEYSYSNAHECNLFDLGPFELAAIGGHYGVFKEALLHFQSLDDEERRALSRMWGLDNAVRITLKLHDKEGFLASFELHVFVFKSAAYPPWLYTAAEAKDVESLHMLLDLDLPDAYAYGGLSQPRLFRSNTVFPTICQVKDAEIVSKFVKKYPRILHEVWSLPAVRKSKIKISALNFAVGHGTEEIVSVLLDAGANPNGLRSAPYRHKPPLHTAIKTGNKGVVKMLLDHGAWIHTHKRWMYDTLKLAVRTGDKDLYDLIRDAKLQEEAEVPEYQTMRKMCNLV